MKSKTEDTNEKVRETKTESAHIKILKPCPNCKELCDHKIYGNGICSYTCMKCGWGISGVIGGACGGGGSKRSDLTKE